MRRIALLAGLAILLLAACAGAPADPQADAQAGLPTVTMYKPPT